MDESPESERRLFQVVFDLPAESPTWPPVSSERLWAEKTDVSLQLAVRNTPFYVRGIANGDVIEVELDDERREIVFVRLVSESGHSAVQVHVRDPRVLPSLENLLAGFDVGWETANVDTYLALDVRPGCDYAALRLRLLELREQGAIGVQEGAISSRHRSQLPSFP